MAFIGSMLTTGSFTGTHKQVATLKSSGGGGGVDSGTASSASSQNTSGSFELVIQTGDVGNGVSYAGSSGSIRIDVKDGGAIRQALRVGANNSGGFVQTGNTSNTGYNFRIVDINNVEYVRVDPANGQTLFNSGAANIDFRVMSDNFSHIFHIDAAEDQVQIGNLSGAAPRNILTLYHGDADGNDGIQIVRNDTSVAENDWLGGIGFDSRDGNTPSSVKEASAFIGAYAAQNQSSIDKGGYMVIGTSAIDEADDTVSTERLRIGPDSLVQVSGSLRIRDDLVVGSNIIRASDGGSTITMDTSDNVQINGKLTVRGDTAASDAAAIGYTASEGIVITGLGSLKDVTIKNQNDAEVISVKAATTSVNFAGDIVVGGNQIKASDGGVTITLDTSDNVTIGNDLTVGGNVIRASDGGATITMDTSDNVTIGGSLTVTGGVIDTTGNLVIDASNEINLDAAGNVINFQDDGSTRYTFNLSPTPELDVAGNFTIDVTGDMTIDCSGGDLRFRNGGNFMGKITMPDPSTTVANGSFVGQSMGYTAFPGHVYTHLAGSSVGAGTSPYNGKYMLAAHSFLHKADGTYRGTNGANAPQSTVYTTRNPQDIGNHYNGASSTSPSNNEHLVTPQTAYSVLLNNADSVKVDFQNSVAFHGSDDEFYIYFQYLIFTNNEEPGDEAFFYFLNSSGNTLTLAAAATLEVDNGSGGFTQISSSQSLLRIDAVLDDYDDQKWRWYRIKVTNSADMNNLCGIMFLNGADQNGEYQQVANVTIRALTDNRASYNALRGALGNDSASLGDNFGNGGDDGDALIGNGSQAAAVDNSTDQQIYIPRNGRARFMHNYWNSSVTSAQASYRQSWLTIWRKEDTKGNIGIYDVTPDYTLDVAGDINATGEVRNSDVALSSDERLKENIEDMPPMLDKVIQLKPRLFDWKEGARGGRLDTEDYRIGDFGFIAQEMSTVLPNMVSVGQDREKLQGVNYPKLTSVLAKAIQELNQKVIDLQAEVDELKSSGS